MSVIKNDYISKNKYTRPGNKLASVKGIIIHWTANPGASASNHQKYFNNGAGGRYASAHIFVDEKEALCIIPLNEVAYAANETGKSNVAKFNGNYGYTGGNANGCTISVEMCVEKDGTISKTVEDKTAAVVAELCKKHKLTEKDVYRHYDITGKSCPTPFIKGTRFSKFKAKVKDILNPKIITVSDKKGNTAKYYKSDDLKGLYRIIKNCYQYKTVKCEVADRDNLIKKGEAITAIEIVKYGSVYRLKTKYGYVTANKEYVQKV